MGIEKDIKQKIRRSVLLNEFMNVKKVYIDPSDELLVVDILDMDDNHLAQCKVNNAYFIDTDITIKVFPIDDFHKRSMFSVDFRKPPVFLQLTKVDIDESIELVSQDKEFKEMEEYHEDKADDKASMKQV